PFPKGGGTRMKEILDLVHTDVCGPMQTTSIGGAKYFATFVDDKSRHVTLYLLKSKDEVFDRFKEFKEYAEKQTGKRIKQIRSDGGGEYASNAFTKYLASQGIRHQTTAPYT